MIQNIPIEKIRLDGATTTRAGVDQDIVSEYAEALHEGAQFPPITLFDDGTDLWLADGHHRVRAYKAEGAVDVPADVKSGTRRDAILFGVSANALHGIRRTREDVMRAVLRLLEDEEWSAGSDNEIARRVVCSPTTVGKIRRSLSIMDSEESAEPAARTYTTKHGTQARMKTGAIGKKPQAPKPTSWTGTASPTPPSPEPRQARGPAPLIREASQAVDQALARAGDPAVRRAVLVGLRSYIDELIREAGE